MAIKLYSVSDGPPSLAVRMALKYLGVNFELIDVDFVAGYHMTDEYAKMNPQKEIPVLDDDGFYLSESRVEKLECLTSKDILDVSSTITTAGIVSGQTQTELEVEEEFENLVMNVKGTESETLRVNLDNNNAILQYLADKYAKDDLFYSKDVKTRAIINHRLAFNLSTYYRNIGEHVMLPIFFGYKRTPLTTKKVEMALGIFNTYLERLNKKFSADDNLTIADLQLVTATICLEAINYDMSAYPKVVEWYERFKKEYPDLWKISEKGMEEIRGFNSNPPDLSHLKHPIHSFGKSN